MRSREHALLDRLEAVLRREQALSTKVATLTRGLAVIEAAYSAGSSLKAGHASTP